jgi:hypothetical protein
MANPHPAAAGNIAWKAAMRAAGFKKNWTNRKRCKATKRNGEPCGRLAMTKYGLSVCGAHGGHAAAARMKLRVPSRKYLLFGPYYRALRYGKANRA